MIVDNFVEVSFAHNLMSCAEDRPRFRNVAFDGFANITVFSTYKLSRRVDGSK